MIENSKDIEKVAGENNIEHGNAIYDDVTKELIDLETLLQEDTPVAHKINNLMKNGVSIEQVKQVYEALASKGTSIEQALDELDKVFFVLAKGITDSPNEIVIDLTTGKIDPIATRDRIIELGLSEEYFDYSHKTKLITEKPVNATIEDIVNNFLGKEPKSTKEMFKKYETLQAFGDYRTIENLVPKEFKNNILNMDFSRTRGEKIAANKETRERYGVKDTDYAALLVTAKGTSVDSIEELDALENVFELAYRYAEKHPPTARDAKLRDVEDTIPVLLEKFPEIFSDVYDENGKIDVSKVLKAQERFEHLRNEGSVAKNLSKILDGKEISEMDLLKTLARSFLHDDDNPAIIEAAKKIAEANGIVYTKEGVIEALNRAGGFDLKTEQDLEKYARDNELSIYTYEGKFNGIEENLLRDLGVVREDYETQNEESTELSEIFSKILDEESLINPETGLNFKGHEVIAVLKHYYFTKGKDAVEVNMIKEYLMANKDYYEKYFLKYTNMNIYKADGTIGIRKIENILDNSTMPEYSKQTIEKIKARVDESIRFRDYKKLSDIVSRIHEIYGRSTEVGKKVTEEDKGILLELVGRLNISKLDPEFIDTVAGMDDDVRKYIEQSKQELAKIEKIRQTRLSKKNKQQAIEESVELIETKLEIFSGTPYYGKVLEERRAFYEKNPNALDYRRKIRNDDGNLTKKGNEKVNNYIEEYRTNKILDHFRGINPNSLIDKEKENYTKWLLVALKSNNKALKNLSIETLKSMYPQLNDKNIKDETSFKLNAYQTVYKDIENIGQLTDKENQLMQNLDRMLFKESIVYTEEKITDANFQEFYDRHAEIFDAATTDLDLGEMQNYYVGSKIEFSQDDDLRFHELYEQSTIDSWLSTKDEASKMTLVSLMALKERAIKKDAENGKKAKSKERKNGLLNTLYVEKKINAFFEKHPELKEMIDENGNVSEELLKEGNEFIENKITSDILKGFSRNLFGTVEEYSNDLQRDKLQKTRYINVMVALKHAEKMEDPKAKEMLQKLAYRALEMMNTDEKTLIRFDDKGNAILNEEEILNTFVSKQRRFNSFDELAEAKYEQYKTIYMYRKLDDYDQKTQDDFFELSAKTPAGKIVEIEKIKRSQKAKYKEEKKQKAEKSAKKTEKTEKAEKTIKTTKPKRNFKLGKHKDGLSGTYIRANKDSIFDVQQKKLREIERKSIDVIDTTVQEVEVKPVTQRFKVVSRDNADNNPEQDVEEKVEYANESETQGTSTLQAEEFNVAEVEAPEETKKDFFKPLKDWWKRMTTPKLGDGKDTTKKPGIFSKLFGKKDRDEEITEGETKEKPKEENSITESKKTFEEEIKVGFDGRLEQSVSNSSNGSKTTMIQNQVENENQSSLEEI